MIRGLTQSADPIYVQFGNWYVWYVNSPMVPLSIPGAIFYLTYTFRTLSIWEAYVRCTAHVLTPCSYPFGMIGLQYIAEEKAWLKHATQICEDLGIKIGNINQHFNDNVWSTTRFNEFYV